jgi:streptogramin lyase
MSFFRLLSILLLLFSASHAMAASIHVVDEYGAPVPTAMVTQSAGEPRERDTSDGGYQAHGKPAEVDVDRTGFTNANGFVNFPARQGSLRYRVRQYGYKDAVTTAATDGNLSVSLQKETDPVLLAAAKPANIWLGVLELGSIEAKQHFQMQCGFCHQLGTSFTRKERSPEEWSELIKRMVRYGSRLPTDLQKSLPEVLPKEWARISAHPEALAPAPAWDPSLSAVSITEWPLGDSMSQMHDMLIAESGLVYVADNIQDRLHEVDTRTNVVTVYKIPHRDGEGNGGLIAGRLKDFPRHDSTSNAHSLAESKRDGHIFITPSAQRRLVEFDPETKKFTLHEMDQGFYPHTIRVDGQDRVWFTLALSNQVAMFDRAAQKFTLYDLPARNFKEKILTRYMHVIFKLIGWGIPLPNMLSIDWESTGTPLAYGIDVSPDGTVWFARLHTKEIGNIDPKTGKITMIQTPFTGPRRLRVDAEGNPWIVAFAESSLAKYAVAEKKFLVYPLPVVPKGSETPYALNVDKKRNVVWVNGNQSDSLYGFDVTRETWTTIPLPRRTTFTRDIEIAEDGTLYTSNSNFPSWHIEDGQPTLIRVERR